MPLPKCAECSGISSQPCPLTPGMLLTLPSVPQRPQVTGVTDMSIVATDTCGLRHET